MEAILFWGVDVDVPVDDCDWLPLVAERLAIPGIPRSIQSVKDERRALQAVTARTGCVVGTYGVNTGPGWQRRFAAIAASVVRVTEGQASLPVAVTSEGADWRGRLAAFCMALRAPSVSPGWGLVVLEER